MEIGSQVVTHVVESTWEHSKLVLHVRVSDTFTRDFTRELFIPAWALDARQKLSRQYWEQLQRKSEKRRLSNADCVQNVLTVSNQVVENYNFQVHHLSFLSHQHVMLFKLHQNIHHLGNKIFAALQLVLCLASSCDCYSVTYMSGTHH